MSKYIDELQYYSDYNEEDESLEDDDEKYEQYKFEDIDEIVKTYKNLTGYINSKGLPICQYLNLDKFLNYLS